MRDTLHDVVSESDTSPAKSGSCRPFAVACFVANMTILCDEGG